MLISPDDVALDEVDTTLTADEEKRLSELRKQTIAASSAIEDADVVTKDMIAKAKMKMAMLEIGTVAAPAEPIATAPRGEDNFLEDAFLAEMPQDNAP